MAGNVGQSILAGKLPAGALVKVHEAVKNDLPKIGGNMGLPSGINNGIAKLSLCQFGIHKEGTTNAGKPYFMAQGRVISPETHNNMKIAGEITKIPLVPLYDTPNAGGKFKTFADHWGKVLAYLENLGLEVKTISGKNEEEIEAKIKAGMELLVRSGTYFRFRTWSGAKPISFEQGGYWYWAPESSPGSGVPNLNEKSKPFPNKEALLKINKYVDKDPLVNETWEKRIDFTPPTASTNGAMQDHSGNGQANTATAEVFNEFATDTQVAVEEPQQEPTEPTPTEDERSNVELVEAINSGDLSAQAELHRRAMATGLTEAQVGEAQNWEQVCEMVEAASGAAEPTADATAIPQKGQGFLYQMLDSRTGQPLKDLRTKQAKPMVEVEVVDVDTTNNTANVRNPLTKSVYKNIPFDQLKSK